MPGHSFHIAPGACRPSGELMKRRLERDYDTSDPPCGLPGELWLQHILPDYRAHYMVNKRFITLRALRLTCKWFSTHIWTDFYWRLTHEHFWPSVEHCARKGYTSLLRQLDWPTHPRVVLSGYISENFSYGRAGGVLAKKGDVETLMLMARRYDEVWTYWVYKAVKHGHMNVLEALYASGIKRVNSENLFGHTYAPLFAISCGRIAMLRLMATYEPDVRTNKDVWLCVIRAHVNVDVLQFLQVTPKFLRIEACSAIMWQEDFAHAAYILDHYCHQRETRTMPTRARRIEEFLGRKWLDRQCYKGCALGEWLLSQGVVMDKQ